MARNSKKIKILLAGGGTGGHIYPLIAVSKEIRRLAVTKGFNADIRYFGDAGDYRPILERNDIKVVHITSSRWRRYFDLDNFLDIFKFLFSIFEGLWKIFFFMPHICFSKGGPGSFSVIAVCRFYFITIVIHESDSVLGVANALAARRAKLIELAFPSAANSLSQNSAYRVVGNPIREEFIQAALESENPNMQKLAKETFGFKLDKPVILFLGGSQGAEKINDFVLGNLPKLIEKFQILHQTGPKNFAAYKQQFDFLKKDLAADVEAHYKLFPYFEEAMISAYQTADLVVARSGSAIFEIAAFGKPAVLIPISASANNHQSQNAYFYAQTGAAVVLEEANFLPGLFFSEVQKILGDANRLNTMKAAAKNFSRPDAAKLIAEDIFKLIIKI